MPAKPSPTTTQSLGSLLKSARDIMRKDKELNGDLDRSPPLITLATSTRGCKFPLIRLT